MTKSPSREQLKDRIKKLEQKIQDLNLTVDKLRESRLYYQTLLDSAPVGIWNASPDGSGGYINSKLAEISGLSSESAKGTGWASTLHPEDKERVFAEWANFVEGKNEYNSTYRFKHPTGKVRWVVGQATPVLNEAGNRIGHIGTLTDITERKQAEKTTKILEKQIQQAQKLEALSTLAGGVAHDLNNILGILLGSTELVMDEVPEWSPARPNLEEIRTGCLRAKDVVRQLLNFSRKTDQEQKPVEINSIVRGVMKLIRSSIPASIEIRSNIPKESLIIFADPTQINQVMINLCTNAEHAMEKDGGILEISLESLTLKDSIAQSYQLAPGRYVKLNVIDTGHGIEPEIVDRIFDPYFTTKGVGKGSGMGLSVVHGIVTNHDGAISVNSDVGEGATFSIFLPIAEKEPAAEPTIDEDLQTGTGKILFIDDEEALVKIGIQRLEQLGYMVKATTSPLEALDAFRSKPDQFDLVVTDLTMPEMRGEELVKEVLKVRPDVPIIICTGFSEKIDREKSIDLGAAEYLEKPYGMSEFASKIRETLNRTKG